MYRLPPTRPSSESTSTQCIDASHAQQTWRSVRPNEDSDRDSCVGWQPRDKSKQHDNEQGDMGAETYLVHLLTHMVPIHCGGDNLQIIRTLISNKPELVRHLVSIFVNDFLQGGSGLNSVGTRTA
jgi:hypothetical protein